ncbi:MAG: DUF4384 domain-containing protein [Pseudomonadota bacterium]
MFQRTALALCVTALLAACNSTLPKAAEQVRATQNPVDRSQRNITNFTPALRCMDDLMFASGTRDVTLMMEELRDATTKVPVSARDMLTSAVSDMTRRSRAVRLSVFGGDQQNLAQLLQQAQKLSAFAAIPEHNIRGTISQLDENVKKESSSFGVVVERAFGVRFGAETKFSVLGFDAAMVETSTFSVVPGVVSKNTTVVAQRDNSAGDGEARILGANAVFAFSAARAEGNAQAARNMVELAAVELVGKLIRAPYWQCLGVADDNPEVLREMDDWFFSMDDSERTRFIQERLRERRYYDGALDGRASKNFGSALAAYRRALGLAAEGPLDAAFFRRFVTQPVPRGPLAPLPRSGAPAAATAPAAAPAQLFVQPDKTDPSLATVRVAALAPGYLYCYAQNPETKAIQRIYPNRFVRDPRIEAGQAISVPGKGKFKLNAAHDFACMHAPTEVYGDLPPPLRWGDFDDVRLASFDEIRDKFAESSGQPIALLKAVTKTAGGR